jgi:hypothetical protein
MIQPLGGERNGDKKREHQRRGESANDFHLETSQCPDSTTAVRSELPLGITAKLHQFFAAATSTTV